MRPAQRRREILESAREVFASRGYHATSVSDIVAAAGIARGTFYLYFESKRAIFDELVDQFIVAIVNCVRPVVLAQGGPPGMVQIRANVSRVLALLTEEREMALVLLNHAVGLDRESDEKLTAFYDRVAGALERAIEKGRDLGLDTARDPAVSARFILGGVKEVVQFLVVRDGPPPAHEDLVDLLLEISFKGVVHGPLHLPESTVPRRADEKEIEDDDAGVRITDGRGNGRRE